MLPPRWVRRVVLAPAMILLTVFLITTFPVWLLVAAAASPLLPAGRWRVLRVLWVVVVHLFLESGLLIVMFVLWIASGFGWRIRSPAFERRHYDLVRFYLRVMFSETRRVLRLRVEVEGPSPADAVGSPLVVFSRHAGPGDSFLVVYFLISVYGRNPRIVLKDTLQWDPAIDVLLNRLPTSFIRPGSRKPGEIEAEIADLASGLAGNDALVIFPEGGNFTERRRAAAIARLRERGHLDEAAKAEQMRHVLAPRTGGVRAALDGAPGADVLWVAHSGLDHLLTVADVWRALPMDGVVRIHWWQVDPSEVPDGATERSDWLYDWWGRIDEWVGEQRAPGAAPLSPLLRRLGAAAPRDR